MATIFSFSATGNSLYAAKKIAERVGGRVISMNSTFATCEDDFIGFVFPVYFWALPRVVAGFISNMRITNKKSLCFRGDNLWGSDVWRTWQVKKDVKR